MLDHCAENTGMLDDLALGHRDILRPTKVSLEALYQRLRLLSSCVRASSASSVFSRTSWRPRLCRADVDRFFAYHRSMI